MRFRETSIPGCLLIAPDVHEDRRGRFVKTYHEEVFKGQGVTTDWREEYYTVSRRGVLRGLHFQVPPHHHHKLVFCAKGAVLDAVVDLRKGSPTFGDFQTFALDSERGRLLLVPPGLAHGFFCISEEAVMFYKVSTVYSPERDAGILWNSAGIPWPEVEPIISDRDRSFPELREFETPFTFEQG